MSLSSPQLPLPLILDDTVRLGQGGTRIVYSLGEELVLKVPVSRWPGGANSNKWEAERWATAGEDEQQLLAPVLAADPDGAWLIMARATAIGHGADYIDPIPEVKEMRDRAVHDYDIHDNHQGNIGWYDNRPVMIDYAEPRSNA